MLKPNMFESWILEGITLEILLYVLAPRSIHQEIMAECEEWKIHEIGVEKHRKCGGVKLEGEANPHEIQETDVMDWLFILHKYKVFA